MRPCGARLRRTGGEKVEIGLLVAPIRIRYMYAIVFF